MTDRLDDTKENEAHEPCPKKKYAAPDFEEESVFETLAAGCTFSNQLNPICKNGQLQFSA